MKPTAPPRTKGCSEKKRHFELVIISRLRTFVPQNLLMSTHQSIPFYPGHTVHKLFLFIIARDLKFTI